MSAEVVYQTLKQRIEQGELPEGDPCPGEMKLCEEFHVARETVRTALRRLAQERYLSQTKRGQARTVQMPDVLVIPKIKPSESFGECLNELGKGKGWTAHDFILSEPRKTRLQDLVQQPRLHNREIADKLSLSLNRNVIWCGRLRLAKGDPIAIQWVVVPANVIKNIKLDNLIPGGLTELYRNQYRIKRAAAEAQYRPALASFSESSQLKIEQNSALIEERRVSYFDKRQPGVTVARRIPYEYLVSLYADRVALEFHW